MTVYNSNIDLVNDKVYIKFDLILSIHSQDIEQKPILTSIKGHNSVSLGPIWPKFELCPDLLVVLVT